MWSPPGEIRNPIQRQGAIGVFDSGVGGLTVLKEIISLLPDEDIIYLGDTARVPYGSKPRPTIVQYALEDARFLLEQKVKALVVACNTICTLAMTELRQEFNLPIIGVIGSASRAAVEETKKKAIGVIGTEGTINSGVYYQTIKQLDNEVEIYSQACPLFVPLVEEGLLEGEIPQKVADMYLSELAKKPIDVLTLGCTHYPLLREPISKCMGPQITVLDPAMAVAGELKQRLSQNNLLSHEAGGYRKCFFTCQPQKAERIIQHLAIRVDTIAVADLPGQRPH
jgi:glutamate racemase